MDISFCLNKLGSGRYSECWLGCIRWGKRYECVMVGKLFYALICGGRAEIQLLNGSKQNRDVHNWSVGWVDD